LPDSSAPFIPRAVWNLHKKCITLMAGWSPRPACSPWGDVRVGVLRRDVEPHASCFSPHPWGTVASRGVCHDIPLQASVRFHTRDPPCQGHASHRHSRSHARGESSPLLRGGSPSASHNRWRWAKIPGWRGGNKILGSSVRYETTARMRTAHPGAGDWDGRAGMSDVPYGSASHS
jgi:hypothetical protein